MLVTLLSSCCVVACGASRDDGANAATSASVSSATFAEAQQELAQPPPVVATRASSLAGVATWTIHQESGSPDAVFEGRNDEGKSVVWIAQAHDTASSNVGVVFEAAPGIGSFDTVRTALQHDLDGPAGNVRPQNQIVSVPNQVGVNCRVQLIEQGCEELQYCPYVQNGQAPLAPPLATDVPHDPNPGAPVCLSCPGSINSPNSCDGQLR
jgi:hypothetical protein